MRAGETSREERRHVRKRRDDKRQAKSEERRQYETKRAKER